MRFSSKRNFIERIEAEHRNLVDLLKAIRRTGYRERGVWGDGWTVNDLLAHLTEWEQMSLRWYREGLEGKNHEIPAPGFRWNETPQLNRAIWRKHRRKSTRRVREEFDASYEEILTVAKTLSARALLSPGHFAWTRRNPLTTYLSANTISHYRTAAKILKRWLRGTKR